MWAGVSIPTADGMAYSLVYNAAYMIPETVVTVYVIALISNAVDLREEKPVTKKKSENVMAILNGALVFGIAVLYRPPKVRPKNLTIGGRYFYGKIQL